MGELFHRINNLVMNISNLKKSYLDYKNENQNVKLSLEGVKCFRILNFSMVFLILILLILFSVLSFGILFQIISLILLGGHDCLPGKALSPKNRKPR